MTDSTRVTRTLRILLSSNNRYASLPLTSVRAHSHPVRYFKVDLYLQKGSMVFVGKLFRKLFPKTKNLVLYGCLIDLFSVWIPDLLVRYLLS
jgi:hypothetical protein